jgi:hypothetical protein
MVVCLDYLQLEELLFHAVEWTAAGAHAAPRRDHDQQQMLPAATPAFGMHLPAAVEVPH